MYIEPQIYKKKENPDYVQNIVGVKNELSVDLVQFKFYWHLVRNRDLFAFSDSWFPFWGIVEYSYCFVVYRFVKSSYNLNAR